MAKRARRQSQHKPPNESKTPKKRELEKLRGENQKLRRQNAKLRTTSALERSVKRAKQIPEAEWAKVPDSSTLRPHLRKAPADIGPKCDHCNGSVVVVELGNGAYLICRECLFRKRVE